jgi:hypothetical protein
MMMVEGEDGGTSRRSRSFGHFSLSFEAVRSFRRAVPDLDSSVHISMPFSQQENL